MAEEEIGKLYIRIEALEKEFQEQMDKLEKSAQNAAKKAEDHFKNFKKNVTSILGTITLAAVTKEIFSLGKAWDEEKANFAKNTGLMGQELDRYLGLIRTLHSKTDLTLQDAVSLVEVLRNKMQLSAEEVEAQMETWEQFMDVFEATPETVAEVDTVLSRFGATDWPAKQQFMDMAQILRTKTNMSIDDLITNLEAISAPAQAAGMDLQKTIGFIGSLSSAGFDASEATRALNQALVRIERPEQLYEIFQKIKDAPTDFDAAGIAAETFGDLGGAKLASAIREGKVSLEEMTQLLGENKDAFERAAEANEKKFSEQLGLLKNKLEEVGITIGEKFMSGLNTIINAFASMPEWAQYAIGALAAVGLAIALAFTCNPVTLFIAALGGIVLAVGYIKENWETIVDFFSNLWESIKAGVQTAWDWVVDKFVWVKDQLVAAWEAVAGFFTSLWENIKNIFWSAYEWIYNNIIKPIQDFFGYLGEAQTMQERLNQVFGVPISSTFSPGPVPTPIPGRQFQFGGLVTPNEIALVGERGPELFVPHMAGEIVPLSGHGLSRLEELLTSLLSEMHVRGGRNELAIELEVAPGSLLELAARGMRMRRA